MGGVKLSQKCWRPPNRDGFDNQEMGDLMVGLFFDLVGPVHIYMRNIKFFGCSICFNFAVARKRHFFPHSDAAYSVRCIIFLFSSKTFPLNPVLQNDAIIVIF